MSGDHDHLHSHAPDEFDHAFAVGIALNFAFVTIEAFYGWKINSLALLADAGHNLSDVAGLVLAWGGALAGRRRPDARHTYGWKRASILAAFINALLLLVAMGSLGWEAAGRLSSPQSTQGWIIISVAGVGILINTATALMFVRGRRDDLNIRGAFLHMAADALVSLGVVMGGVLYLWQGWNWIDPFMSLAIAAFMVLSTWNLFKQSLHLLFDGVPVAVDLDAVHELLLNRPGVEAVHDLHIWAMGTADIVLTAHVVLRDQGVDRQAFLWQAVTDLRVHFRIGHVTLQLESPAYALRCALREGCGRTGAKGSPISAKKRAGLATSP